MEDAFLKTMSGVTFSAPAQVFIGLFLSSPGESGAAGTEIAYAGYQRMPIVFTPPTAEGQGMGIRNSSQITFPQAPANSGTVRFIGIFDSTTGGNMYLYGELAEDLPVTALDSPVFLLNDIVHFSTGDLSLAYKRRLYNVVRGTSLQGFTSHISLFNGDPEDGGAELAGSNYMRTPVSFSAPQKETSGLTVIRNIVRADFPRPLQNWGTWTHTAIFDSLTAGEPVWIQQRAAAKVINRGIMPFVEVNDLTFGIN